MVPDDVLDILRDLYNLAIYCGVGQWKTLSLYSWWSGSTGLPLARPGLGTRCCISELPSGVTNSPPTELSVDSINTVLSTFLSLVLSVRPRYLSWSLLLSLRFGEVRLNPCLQSWCRVRGDRVCCSTVNIAIEVVLFPYLPRVSVTL